MADWPAKSDTSLHQDNALGDGCTTQSLVQGGQRDASSLRQVQIQRVVEGQPVPIRQRERRVWVEVRVSCAQASRPMHEAVF